METNKQELSAKANDEARILHVQTSIIESVLRSILSISAVAVLVSVVWLFVSVGFSQSNRLFTGVIVLAFIYLAHRGVRLGRPHQAVVLTAVGIGSAGTFAMLMNGGLRAPGTGLGLLLVALCSLSFGRLVGTLVSAGSTVFLLLLYLFHDALPAAPLPPLSIELLVSVTFLWLLWSASSIPQEKVREALSQAFARERELFLEQERTREAHLAFKAVFDQTTHMMSLISPAGLLLSTNRPSLQFMGLHDVQALVGKPFEQAPCWPEAERPALQRAITQSTAQGASVHFQTLLSNHAGQARTIAFSLSPFRDEAGTLRYLIAEGRDVTEMMEIKERQERKQRLVLVGRMAGGVAHDINNVLAAILTATELLKDDLKRAEDLELAEIIIGASQRARDLTRRLLTFARRSPLEKQALPIAEMLEETLQLISRTLPPNIKIARQLEAKRSTVKGNAGALQSAILNLVFNARDAMPDGGLLTVSTRQLSLDDEWFSSRGEDVRPGEYLCLSIEDTGCGIPLHLQSRIFEPFFTTKAEGRGTGLGLASVYGVVHDHGGVAEMSSQEGRGTVFRLYFPLVQETKPVAAAPLLRSFEGKRALLVDDEPALRVVVSRLLGSLGFQCTIAPDAESGLLAFQKDPGSFDLAMLDVVLPGMRGTELAPILLSASPSLRILLASGFQKEAELHTLPPTQARFLSKPFTLEALRAALSELFPEAPLSKEATAKEPKA